jgi:hypothetical protein
MRVLVGLLADRPETDPDFLDDLLLTEGEQVSSNSVTERRPRE